MGYPRLRLRKEEVYRSVLMFEVQEKVLCLQTKHTTQRQTKICPDRAIKVPSDIVGGNQHSHTSTPSLGIWGAVTL